LSKLGSSGKEQWMFKKTLITMVGVVLLLSSADCLAKPTKTKVSTEIEVAETSDAAFAKDVLNSPQPVLVDFYATWCGPCRFMTPIVDRLAKKYKKDLKVFRVDIDKNPKIAEELDITGIPMFAIYKNGKMVETAVGAMPKEKLTAMVERNIQL
jgi:thioredoxin 1